MSLITPHRLQSDYLIIGSGIAGLYAALKAAAVGSVIVVTKKCATDCNTSYAQGGIACVFDNDDALELHCKDTIEAGAGLCDMETVRRIIAEGPGRIKDLIAMGINFTRRSELDNSVAHQGYDDGYDLAQEGGHSRRRILHAGDITGKEIIRVLMQACQAHPKITILEGYHAIDLIASRRLDWDGPNRCLGAYVLERKTNVVHSFLSRFVIMATGGAGKVYLYTSNPDIACGEGIAMAYRAYAQIANMEFFQFHPTCLYHPEAKSFLISEAVRGEGGILKIGNREQLVSFMENYHPEGNLAPRDIVARAIDQELKKSGQPFVYLDITHHSEEFLRSRFPHIYHTCLRYGIDMAKDPIPVVPAAHYCCGGVKTDVNGATCVQNLYAAGEVGHTGLHGANRLASNSLLEALVVANLAVEHSKTVFDTIETRHINGESSRYIPDWSSGNAVDADELIVIYHNWDEIRRFMWDYVGIFRTTKRLQRAKTRIRNIRKEIETFYWDFILTADLIELRNLTSVAELIIDSALARHHSVGLHYNSDYPPGAHPIRKKDTILTRPGFNKSLV